MKQTWSGLSGLLILFGGMILLMLMKSVIPSIANFVIYIFIGAAILIALLVIAVLYFAFRKPGKPDEKNTADEHQALLNSGKKNLMGLRRMSMEIKNKTIRTLTAEICGTVDQILQTLKERQDRIASMNQFFNYYLPTMEKILTKYQKLESGGAATEQITESTITCLEDIREAMKKQYSNLFEHDILDLTVEMEVLTHICKRDGLLDAEDFSNMPKQISEDPEKPDIQP